MAAERAPPHLDEYATLEPAVLQRAGWTPEELYWEELSAAALALLGKPEAAEYWREAARTAPDTFAPGDPRLATSLANLALVETRGADNLLAEAVTVWQASASWLADLRPERRARSSLFHLRLARRHLGGYDHWSRARYADLHAEGARRVAQCQSGVLSLTDPYADWRARRPADFDDGRRLAGAVLLIAPDRVTPS